MDPAKVLGHEFEETEMEYTERDVALYALGVGAAAANQCDPLELPLVYNHLFKDSFKVLPTFGVLLPASLVDQFLSLDGLVFNPALLLHGEQFLEVYRPLPPRAKVRSSSKVVGLADKGKAALLVVETLSRDAETGEPLCLNRTSAFLRGAGGFSQSQHGAAAAAGPPPYRGAAVPAPPADRGPDFVHEDTTQLSQALLYRLSGDYNPLHSDPEFAAAAGFDRPILHGLCTLGFAVRAVIRRCCAGEPGGIRSLHARFLLHVFPGETIVTEMWAESAPPRVIFRCKTKERGLPVLTGVASLNTAPSKL